MIDLKHKTGNFDEVALARIIDKFADDLFIYTCCIVKSKSLAEEVVDDVFIELWKNRQSVCQIENMKSWLLVLARNKSISMLRKEQRHSYHTLLDDEAFEIACSFQTPDEQIISSEEVANINAAIGKLPPRCQEVFVLAKIQKLPYKEISSILNISVKTINAHIAKALSVISEAIN